MEKIIKPIKDYPGYYISNYGEVYSTWDRSVNAQGKIGRGGTIHGPLKRIKSLYASGRWCVGLSKNGKRRIFRIHKLVLEAFIGQCPKGMEACHFPDRDTSNNRLDNLRWDTKKSNQADRVFHKTDNSGERNGSAKLKKKQVLSILQERMKSKTYQKLATKYFVSLATIQFICQRKTWKHLED